MIEEDGLYQFLNSDATIRNLVNGRIYGATLPPKASGILPAIVYLVVGGDPIESLDGDNSTEEVIIQFSCHASTYKQSRILARAVKSLIIPKSDGSGSTPTVSYDLPDGTHVQSARLHRPIQDSPIQEGDGGYEFHASFDAELTYSS